MFAEKRFAALALAAALTAAMFATQYSGDFEELGTSARALGMGGSVVASATGPTAIYYNPALASRTKGISALLLHSEDFSGLLQHNYLGVTFPSRLQSVGVALLHNGIPGIKLTALPDTTQPPGEHNRPYVERVVNANQFVGYVNYSRVVTPHVALGANAKLIYHDLGVGSCFGMGIDLGLALTPSEGFDIGLRVRNASTSPLFWTTGTRELILPRVGLGLHKTLRLGRDALGFAFEVEGIPEEAVFTPNLGIEYSFRNVLFGRLGVHRSNFTFGLGGRYKRFFLDYGYSSGYAPGARDLGSAQQFSGGMEF